MGDGVQQSTCADWLEKIQDEITHLRDYLNQGADCIEKGINTSEISRIAATFFVDTMDAICEQVRADRLTQARILIRPLLELGVSLRWASITDLGWCRLLRYHSDEADKEVASGMQALGITVSDEDASEWEVERVPLLVVDPRPTLKACFDKVWNDDVSGVGCQGDTKPAPNSNPLYNVVYRSLCGPGHANLFNIGQVENKQQLRKVIMLDCAFAGQFLFRAISKVLGQEQTSSVIETLIKELGDQ